MAQRELGMPRSCPCRACHGNALPAHLQTGPDNGRQLLMEATNIQLAALRATLRPASAPAAPQRPHLASFNLAPSADGTHGLCRVLPGQMDVLLERPFRCYGVMPRPLRI